MNDLVPMIGDGEKISPWEKPGGTLGLVVAGGALGGGAILLYKILPWLITLTSNILTLSLLVGALFLIAFLVTDKRFRKTVSMIYFLIMRKITGLVIEIDPIAIVEMKVKEMREKITVIKNQISNVKGLVDLNTKKVEQKKIELARQINLLNEYRKRGDTEHAIVVERQVVRLQSSVDRQQKRLEESRKWNDILDKLKERAMLVVEDTENEVADR
ncbi:MAG: hypothetical protein J6Y37_10930, partial [Paludibacteraceae bacterium]|nr:hypothetical protein [Paludibacteraceae bacterium]